jgi:hypothetical protein
MVSAEQEVLGRLLVIRRMVKEKDFGSCVALTDRIIFNLAQFSNIPLKNEIKDSVLAMKYMINSRNENETMKNLDKTAKSLVKIFARYGIE